MNNPEEHLFAWLRDSVQVAKDGIAEFGEAFREKPGRITQAYQELLAGYLDDPSELLKYRVPGTKNREYGEVWARKIPFLSFCAHHFLPFTGTITVGYIPGDGLLGIGKLPRLVQCRAKRFQLQERLTVEIVNDLINLGNAKWARAESSAQHLCVCFRGPREASSDTFSAFESGHRK